MFKKYKNIFYRFIFLPTAIIAVGFLWNAHLSKKTLVDELPSGDRWLAHAQKEIMPFWTMKSALGEPLGAFPSIRCNDGTPLDFDHPCSEINGDKWLLQKKRYLVSQSRQIFAYGAAFHMTGDRQYLEYMKSGVRFVRDHFMDREHGGMYTEEDLVTGMGGPAWEQRNPQELAYGLLGLSFYYYLTRDGEVLKDILEVKKFIFEKYYDPKGDFFLWTLKTDDVDAKKIKITAPLDQMNAYLVLLAPIIPEPYRSEWTKDLLNLSRIIRKHFYSKEDNSFYLSKDMLEGVNSSSSETDFGHSIKAFAMIRFAGLLNRQKEFVTFGEKNGQAMLLKAYNALSGAWDSGVVEGGQMLSNRDWWIYAEEDQYAATLSLKDLQLVSYLNKTYRYWFNHFLDKTSGEVWTSLDGASNKPRGKLPKQWPWKNGYHTMEHALISYITTQQLKKKPVVLYYSFRTLPEKKAIRPYFFEGQLKKIERSNEGEAQVWRAEFIDIR